MKISVIVPAYNEAKRIAPTLRSIANYFEGRPEELELIVVDDGSRDNTRQVCEGLKIKELRVVDYGGNRGKGYAVNYGVQQAKGDWIIFTDADNSTPIEELAKLYNATDSHEVVIGSRYVEGSYVPVKQSAPRIIASRLGNALIRLVLLGGIHDTQCGFKMFSAAAAKTIFPRQTIFGWGFDMEILRIARENGYKIKEIGVTWRNDDASKIQSSRIFIKTLKELFMIKVNSLSGRYRSNKSSELRRVVKFALVGAIGTLIDFVILNIAVAGFGLNLYLAVSLGFAAGAINNYALNSLWSFGQKMTFKKFSSYFSISLVGLLFSNMIVYLFADQFGWHYNAAKVVAVVIVFGWNYVLNRQVTFGLFR